MAEKQAFTSLPGSRSKRQAGGFTDLDGWEAKEMGGTHPGVQCTVASFFPGPNGYLGVTIWPWVQLTPTCLWGTHKKGFSTKEKERNTNNANANT